MTDSYFQAYGWKTHKLMLEDESRMNAYFSAVENNKELFRNRRVLDVGSGSGVLSIFSAKYAERVYAIEANEEMCLISEKNLEENNLTSKVKIVNKLVEDLTISDLEGEKVDIIISEWMGMYLLHEAMLDSVVFARDSFLKTPKFKESHSCVPLLVEDGASLTTASTSSRQWNPDIDGGLMFPTRAILWASLADASLAWTSKMNWWSAIEDRYNVKLGAFAPKSRDNQPLVAALTSIHESHRFCTPMVVREFDLHTVTHADLNCIETVCTTSVQEPSPTGLCHGFVLWFDVLFPSPSDLRAEIGDCVFLSTSPSAAPTHWKQTLILLEEPLPVDMGLQITVRITATRRDTSSRNSAMDYDRQYTLSVAVEDAVFETADYEEIEED